MEKSPQPTPDTSRDDVFAHEYNRHQEEVSSDAASSSRENPKGKIDLRYRQYAERQKAAKRESWEADELAKQEQEKTYGAILDPLNIIKLKHQTVGPNMTLKDVHERIAKAEADKSTTPDLENWKPGRIKGAEAKIKQLQNRIEEIEAGLDELKETYLDGFDPEGTLPINDEFRAELEKMLSLSFKELKELAENPDKAANDSKDSTKKEETAEKTDGNTTKEESETKEDKDGKTAEIDTTSPEVIEAQKLAAAYWQERLEKNLQYLKNPQPGSGGQDFDIARCAQALREIEAGNFFEDFKFEGPYDGEIKSGDSKSIHQFFKDLVDNAPAYIAWLEASDISDKQQRIKEHAELVKTAAEIVAAIGSKPEAKPKKGPETPDTPPAAPDYRAQAEKAAKDSAEAYEKTPARAEAQQRDEEKEWQKQLEAYRLQAEQAAKASAEAYARTKAAEALDKFNKDMDAHQKMLKDKQEAERQRVQAEEEAERKRLEDEKEQREATEQGLEAARLQKLTAIEEAANKNKKGKDGKKRSRADRINELHALALKYSGEKGPGDIDDLGMEVVKRISKSVFYNKLDPRRLLTTPNQKDALYTLRMMANAGNKTAEHTLPWVRLTRTRSVNKGRFGTQREIKRKSKK